MKQKMFDIIKDMMQLIISQTNFTGLEFYKGKTTGFAFACYLQGIFNEKEYGSIISLIQTTTEKKADIIRLKMGL